MTRNEPMNLERVAVHESGHIIVAHDFDVGVGPVAVEDTHGHAAIEDDMLDPIERCAVCVAGYVAESIVYQDVEFDFATILTSPLVDDHRHLCALIEEGTESGQWTESQSLEVCERAMGMAHEILQRRRQTLTQLSDRLVIRRILTETELEAMLQ